MHRFVLEDLSHIIQRFEEADCDVFSNCCIIALKKSNHLPGCSLSVTGDAISDFILDWTRNPKDAARKEPTEYHEHGAIAIAFFLCHYFTNYYIYEEALIGTGVDYWLAKNENEIEDDPDNFLVARLEISAIGKENGTNTVDNRVKIKLNQVIPSNETQLPVCIVVTEFHTPKSKFIMK